MKTVGTEHPADACYCSGKYLLLPLTQAGDLGITCSKHFLYPKQSVAKCQSPALPRPKIISHHNPVVLYYSSAKKFICVWMSESFKRRLLK